MRTVMEIQEFLANPIVSGLLLIAIIIPIFYGLIRFLEWINKHNELNQNENILSK